MSAANIKYIATNFTCFESMRAFFVTPVFIEACCTNLMEAGFLCGKVAGDEKGLRNSMWLSDDEKYDRDKINSLSRWKATAAFLDFLTGRLHIDLFHPVQKMILMKTLMLGVRSDIVQQQKYQNRLPAVAVETIEKFVRERDERGNSAVYITFYDLLKFARFIRGEIQQGNQKMFNRFPGLCKEMLGAQEIMRNELLRPSISQLFFSTNAEQSAFKAQADIDMPELQRSSDRLQELILTNGTETHQKIRSDVKQSSTAMITIIAATAIAEKKHATASAETVETSTTESITESIALRPKIKSVKAFSAFSFGPSDYWFEKDHDLPKNNGDYDDIMDFGREALEIEENERKQYPEENPPLAPVFCFDPY